MRISIVGVSCSGKSTLARIISEKLRLPYIEQDELFYMAKLSSTNCLDQGP